MTSTRTYPIPGLPATHLAEDGSRLTLRTMTSDDEAALLAFYRAVPEADRFYLKDDVTAPEVIAQWAGNLDFNRVVPLVALDGERIVAQGTLHRQRAGARRHSGSVRVVVHPDYRDKGIGRGLLHKLAEVAQNQDIERLLFEVVAGTEEPARRAATLLGFRPVATLPGLVRDTDGTPHDLVILAMNVREEFPPLPDTF